jgi:hypothetical protein
MYKLPAFNVVAMNKENPTFSGFISDAQGNALALCASFTGGVGDVSIGYWNGANGRTVAGSVVAVPPVALSGSPTFAEAYDTLDGGNLWRRRAVGMLLTHKPLVGDVVRVRHFGRVSVDKNDWTGLTKAGQTIYLRTGTVGDIDSYGRMTPVLAETVTGLAVGTASYGPHVIYRPKLVP